MIKRAKHRTTHRIKVNGDKNAGKVEGKMNTTATARLKAK